MAPTEARQTCIDGREKPTSGELQAMCLTGVTGAKREMLKAGGWDQLALIATTVSRLDKSAVISGTYYLLQGSPRMLCISGRDLWPACTHSTKKAIKGAVLMPKANNQNMGIFSMAILDATLVERPPGSDDPPPSRPNVVRDSSEEPLQKRLLA